MILAFCLAACSGTPAPTASQPAAVTATPPAPTATPPPTAEPSPTPVPLAAIVNNQPIPLADYAADVARFEAAANSLGRDLTNDSSYHNQVLDSLIDQVLLQQAAQAVGLSVADADVQSVYDEIVQERGGQAGFDQWLQANLYTAEGFRADLRAGLLANAVQTQVAAGVPADVDQVHAREILVSTREEADKIEADLAAGADFATLAVNNSLDPSRINGGDLGWFPAGGLTQPEVAQAAFALQPNEISQPVQSALGFHIVQVLERGTRPLSAAALAALQKQAVEAWRADLRSKAKIQKLVP